MPIEEKRRKEQTSAAGKASGEKRSRQNRTRNRQIVLSFAYMKGVKLSNKERSIAKEFLNNHGVELKDDRINPVQILAKCTGLSERAIQLILKKEGAYSKVEPVDRQELNIISVVSTRLKEARKLCNYSPQRAAGELGISPSELNRYERAPIPGTLIIPLSVIKKAGEVYVKSLDYFFGIVDEHDDENQDALIVHSLTEQLNQMHLDGLNHVSTKLSAHLDLFDKEFKSLVAAIVNIKKAESKVRELYADLGDTPPDIARLLGRINGAVTIANNATINLVHSKVLPIESLRIFNDSSMPDDSENHLTNRKIKNTTKTVQQGAAFYNFNAIEDMVASNVQIVSPLGINYSVKRKKTPD